MRYTLAIAVWLVLANLLFAQCGCGNPGCRCGASSFGANGNGYHRDFTPQRYYIIRENDFGRFRGYYPSVRDYGYDPRLIRGGFSVDLPRLGLSVGG